MVSLNEDLYREIIFWVFLNPGPFSETPEFTPPEVGHERKTLLPYLFISKLWTAISLPFFYRVLVSPWLARPGWIRGVLGSARALKEFSSPLLPAIRYLSITIQQGDMVSYSLQDLTYSLSCLPKLVWLRLAGRGSVGFDSAGLDIVRKSFSIEELVLFHTDGSLFARQMVDYLPRLRRLVCVDCYTRWIRDYTVPEGTTTEFSGYHAKIGSAMKGGATLSTDLPIHNGRVIAILEVMSIRELALIDSALRTVRIHTQASGWLLKRIARHCEELQVFGTRENYSLLRASTAQFKRLRNLIVIQPLNTSTSGYKRLCRSFRRFDSLAIELQWSAQC